MNGVDDEDFVVIDEDDVFPNGNVDEEDVPTDASEGEEGPDAGVLDLYLKLFQLRDNPLGLALFSQEEEVLIELLQLLRDLNCPLKAFTLVLTGSETQGTCRLPNVVGTAHTRKLLQSH